PSSSEPPNEQRDHSVLSEMSGFESSSVSPSFEKIEPSRMLPKVSFRGFLATTLLGAVLFASARWAGNGAVMAGAVLVAFAYFVLFLAVCVMLFGVCQAFAVVRRWRDPDLLEGSPFADGQLPPQWLPPREQEK
ncbi:MAG: hypothetical protein AAF989_17180, partial [Planctomycetota bacterium]